MSFRFISPFLAYSIVNDLLNIKTYGTYLYGIGIGTFADFKCSNTLK